jgi:hypothetical protein
MKLELKHLAPYLPYGLKTKYILSDVIRLSSGQKNETRDSLLTLDNVKFSIIYCKPILRPLEDLEKYFKPLFNKENEDVMEYLDSEYLLYFKASLKEIENLKIAYLPHGTVTLLYKHHFDLNDLIPAGLAIDINTL